MGNKTKIIVLKLKDILFYLTLGVLGILLLLLIYILFMPDAASASAIIGV